LSKAAQSATIPTMARFAEDAPLARLIAAGHPLIAIATPDEPVARELVAALLATGERPLFDWTVSRGLGDGRYLDADRIAQTDHPAAAFYHLAHQAKHPCAAVFYDAVAHLDDARTLRAFRECVEACRQRGSVVILIDHLEKLPPVVDAVAVRHVLPLPDDAEIEQVLRRTVKRLHEERPITVDLRKQSVQTIVSNLRGLSRSQIERVVAECVAEDRRLDEADITTLLALKRRVVAASFGGEAIEFVETPRDLARIGGLRRLKKWLRQRSRGFTADAQKFGLEPPRGVLLLGVQGGGKSLCAKAVAAAWQLPLLRLDPGALFDRYVGESERKLREAFTAAERMSPVVLWIDEIEKGFASAASRSSDGGLSQRMLGALLTWMQERASPVFLFATANDIEALPPELLRKGRFDEIFFVDLPGADVRAQILEIHLASRGQEPKNFDLPRLAAATDGYSGAELEQGVIAALHESFGTDRALDSELLERTLRGSPPLSVTMSEKIDALRRWAKGRCVPADE
jgi:ATP-dependent 26S proteasome regulatory subunit